MKKFFLFIGVIIYIAPQADASKNDVYMTIYRKGHVEKNTTVHRSPMLPPIDVTYDSEAHQIEVVGDNELEVQIFLYDENGNILDNSNCINTFLNVPTNYDGIILISIESDDWIASGEIYI